MKNSKIIYSINIADIQEVAMKVLGRKLSGEELKIIEYKIGDYFSWSETIEMAIEDHIIKSEIENPKSEIQWPA